MKPFGVLFCALLALAACGKKGDPEPPGPSQFPQQYPKAEALPELQNGQPAAPVPQQQPQQPPSALSPLQPYP